MEWQRSKWDGNAGVMGTKRKATRRARAMHVSTNWFQMDTVTEVGSVRCVGIRHCMYDEYSILSAYQLVPPACAFGCNFGSEFR